MNRVNATRRPSAKATVTVKQPAQPAAGSFAHLLTAARKRTSDRAVLRWLNQLAAGDGRDSEVVGGGAVVARKRGPGVATGRVNPRKGK
jgi:hypothetical protein